MWAMRSDLLDRLVRKAGQSRCMFRVSAMAFDRRGRILGMAMNQPRFHRPGGGRHAEMELMRTLKGVRTILICRIGQGGAILPLEPCRACSRKASKLGIRIVSVRI